jgi:uncharacterized membrane protein
LRIFLNKKFSANVERVKMILYCYKCGKVVGKDIEGKIRKGTKFICWACSVLMNKPKMDMPEGLDELFGKFK